LGWGHSDHLETWFSHTCHTTPISVILGQTTQA